MANMRTLSRSFAGGEVTPELYGRLDLSSFQTGLATCRNFITLPHGPAMNRPGFEFVRVAKGRARLIPFSFSDSQTFAIECGGGYMRFHTNGATLMSGGAPYEVATPYTEADIFSLHYVQSADVLTLVHPNYAPRELRRLSATNWELKEISFIPTIPAPTGLAATPGFGNGFPNIVYSDYVVTAVTTDTQEESAGSVIVTVQNDLSLDLAFNTVTWTAVAGAARYNIYKKNNGLLGYIGQTAETSFVDDNIIPDVSRTPPIANSPFVGAGNYPAAVSYFEQRRDFGGTTNKPQNIWMTRTGTESNLSSSIPTRDDDAISFRIAAREANTIRHIVPLSDLVLLTSSAVWRVTSVNTDAITPSSVNVRMIANVGASDVQPAVAGNAMLYAQSKGGRIRELVYALNEKGQGGYSNTDICLMAPHLFDFKTVVDMAFVRTPYPILWAVSSDGKLLGLTYVPEQKVAGWHKHDTDGMFESVTAVSEGNEDALYAVINRNGTRYIERMHTRQFETMQDAFFVDCGLTYRGAPVTLISGLNHLEGRKVAILADGAVQPQQVVSDGTITLEEAASVVHVGLPITADLKTLPLAYEQIGALGQGRPKNINKVFMRLYRSSGVWAGPDEQHLREFKQRRAEMYGTPPDLIESDEIEVPVDPNWNQNGHVFVRQSDPLPLTISAMAIEAAVGG